MTDQNAFRYGGYTIPYALERAARKTLAITVRPDCSVVVRAPQSAELAAIEKILYKRAAWIVRQQRFFAQFLPRTPARRYVSGETHLYLGRQYRLRVRLLGGTESGGAVNGGIEGKQKPQAESEGVRLLGGYLYIWTQTPADPERVRALLEAWYAAHAEARFAERLAICMASVEGWRLETPRLRVRRMAKRWGSCGPGHIVTLNADLIRAPRACIDYVILHELCHLRCPNHSPEFYRLLGTVLPDWETRKLRLEKMLS